MRFSDRVKALNLPLDQVVVIGSGLLDQLELRVANDIDLVVTPEVLARAEASGEYECGVRQGDKYCRKRGIELWSNWNDDVTYDDLVASARIYDDVRFASPDIIIAKKRQRGSTKDISDITLLEAYDAGK